MWYWASAGKVVTGSLIGQAAAEGVLSLDDPASDYLGTGWTACAEEEDAITVCKLLTMTSGQDDGVANLDCTLPDGLDCLSIPGTRWAYLNGDGQTNVGDVLAMLAGFGVACVP